MQHMHSPPSQNTKTKTLIIASSSSHSFLHKSCHNMSTSNHPFLEFPQIQMMGKTVKWKGNAIEIAPNCPRCFSSNTKFCYYNNYSVSQPRYFCKACRRYWTKGGSLRNVPIGGACRKTRRGRLEYHRENGGDDADVVCVSAAAPANYVDRDLVKDYDHECCSFAPSKDRVIDGGGDQLQHVHGCIDGRDFVYQNFDVFDLAGSEMFSNLEGFGCEQQPLMQEFEVFSTDDDDQLIRMSDDNLMTANWASFDLSAYDNF